MGINQEISQNFPVFLERRNTSGMVKFTEFASCGIFPSHL
jgi:hypothetical protein